MVLVCTLCFLTPLLIVRESPSADILQVSCREPRKPCALAATLVSQLVGISWH
ncbi:hypothetical protein JIQ42_06003 [Leishmania sp. Namibia]|uniref:hypothetical protein n=1 Tax=Leishmania sp. Namibia TaxID=2802991 RepID=UPI001B69D80E|nr:hypothetical protein JIQ42_06003 [Leishmania sp. Namibia]